MNKNAWIDINSYHPELRSKVWLAWSDRRITLERWMETQITLAGTTYPMFWQYATEEEVQEYIAQRS